MTIFDKRKSGILLHITSLPSEFGIGDLGPFSYQFADILKKSKQSFWEILPLNPTSISKGNSPYATSSAFAGNTLLVSPQLLYEEGLLKKNDIKKIKNIFNNQIYIKYVDYKKVTKEKNKIFQKAFGNFKSINNKKLKDGFYSFCIDNDKKWLDNFAFFNALSKKLNYIPWSRWPDELKNFKSSIFFNDENIENLKNFNFKKYNLEDFNLKSFEKKISAGKVKFDSDFDIYEDIKKEKFLQFTFFKQWINLKSYCNNLGIKIIGDIPIYVDFGSSDVWANSEIFKLDSNKNPAFVSGVPPDYFSKSGQLWGSPVYNWDNLKKNNYKWWINRIEYNLNLFDFVRIDHFRGFIAYWEVPSEEKTAKNGKWVRAYPEDFFCVLKKELSIKFNNLQKNSTINLLSNLQTNHLNDLSLNKRVNTSTNLKTNMKTDISENTSVNLSVNTSADISANPSAIPSPNKSSNILANFSISLPIIAENLGYITPDVEEIMQENNFPGLKVILFAFGKDFPAGTHLPHNYDKNCIAYTGTHDNNTIKGWFLKEAKNYEKKNLLKYIGKDLNLNSVNEDLIRLIVSSAAGLIIIPVQDVLGLGSEARMNHPSTIRGNWKWRMTKKDFILDNFKKLKEFTEIYSRI